MYMVYLYTQIGLLFLVLLRGPLYRLLHMHSWPQFINNLLLATQGYVGYRPRTLINACYHVTGVTKIEVFSLLDAQLAW